MLHRAIAVLGGVLVLVTAPIAGAQPVDDDNRQPGHPGYNGAPMMGSGQPIPTMNGVPCIPGNIGTCSGFAQNQPRPTTPQSTIGHSPTVR